MSGCALRRWGSGTPCVKEPATEASKELSSALKLMQAERERQDRAWTQPVEDDTDGPLVAVPVPVKKKTTQ